MKLPADITPDSLTAIIDTREQTPLDLSPMAVERAALVTGDYSLRGLARELAKNVMEGAAA